MVAGIIGAEGENGIGMNSLANSHTGGKIRLMPIRILDEFNQGSFSTLLYGLDYALANGAKIINLSVGSRVTTDDNFAKILAHAFHQAGQQGVLVVGAAGNQDGGFYLDSK